MGFGQNFNIELISFPITEIGGTIQNVFKGFVSNEIVLQVQDCNITNIVESTTNPGKIKISVLGGSVLMATGNNLTITGGLYKGKTGEITDDTADPQFEVDIDYIGDEPDNHIGFINRLDDDYKLEYRFVVSDTVDVQTEIPILADTTFFISNDVEGFYRIDINTLSDLFKATFDVIDSSNEDMNNIFQVQIREIENGSVVTGTWETIEDTSLTQFDQFITSHATGDESEFDRDNTFLDKELDTRYWREYLKPVSFLISDANRSISSVQFNFTEKSQSGVTLATSANFKSLENGVNYFSVSLATSTSRFLDVQEKESGDVMRYTIMDTLEDATEFYLTWLSESGSIRTWLFSAQSADTNEYDKISVEQITFRDIPTVNNRTVTLVTRGLSENEFKYVKSIIGSNLIKIENNGLTFECSIESDSVTFTNKQDTYDFEFDINIKPNETLKV